ADPVRDDVEPLRVVAKVRIFVDLTLPPDVRPRHRSELQARPIVSWRPSPELATIASMSDLAAILRERSSEILASWIVRFERSPLRLRRATKAAAETAQVASLVEALTVAASAGAEKLLPGSNLTRELERSAAFLGAQFASEGATGYDVAALLLE